MRIIAENLSLILIMATRNTTAKKRVVVSYANLSPELIEALKKCYPLGFTDHMIRIDKPNGDFFYAVVLDTDEVTYLVKVNVKIDSTVAEELEKDLFHGDEVEDINGAEDIADTADDE